MSSLKILYALTAASLVLPSRVLLAVEAAPHPHPHPHPRAFAAVPQDLSKEAGARVRGGTTDESGLPSGQIALQLPDLGGGIDEITDAGLGVVGNITAGSTPGPDGREENGDGEEAFVGPSTSDSTAVLARRLNLTSHWQAPLPPPGSNVQSYEFIADKWQLWHNRLYGGQESNLHMIQDPFFTPGLTTGAKPLDGASALGQNNGTSEWNKDNTEGGGASTVLQVDYQTGTYRQGGPHSEGGITFFPYPMEMKSSNKILLRYEVAFKRDFDFVKGGKLPGLFNGLKERDCSGGLKADQDQCFSVRMMWRENGLGEGRPLISIYLYLYYQLMNDDLSGFMPLHQSTPTSHHQITSVQLLHHHHPTRHRPISPVKS